MEFVDDYEHKKTGILYFPRNIPTKEAEQLYEYSLNGCHCPSQCKKDSNCSCIEKSGTTYCYDNISDIENYTIQDNKIKKPTYECHRNCKCKNVICGNKVVQFGPRKGLEVKVCENQSKGFGLFTGKNLRAGNFVCEYAGEIITANEASERFQVNKTQEKMNYIFCINETFGTNNQKTFIDPTFYGNIGRYINHSCNPNCKLIVIRESNTIPILGIFANQDIKENTELTYTYGDLDVKDGRQEQRKPCFCNSVNCKKFLPFDSGLP